MSRLILILVIAVAIYLMAGGPRARAKLKTWLVPALAVLLSLLYVRSPIDVVPDVSPIGFLDDLLVLIGTFWWVRRKMGAIGVESAPSEPRRDSARGWDPHAVLGISRGASREAISRAYREKMKHYHPDRVNGLGEELQQLAHEKTLEIQRAYSELKGAG